MADGFKENKDFDIKFQRVLNREICWIIYRMNADPKKAIKDIEVFMPIENKPTVKKATKAQLEKIRLQAEAINAKLNSR